MQPDSKHKAVFHILDHIFIYVAIAGSYTPVALSVIGGWQGVAITVVQWAMVLFGIFYKSLSRRSIPGCQPDDIFRHGMDGRVLAVEIRAQCVVATARAYRRRRHPPFDRSGVLCEKGFQVSSSRMASFHRPCGDMPFHRHSFLSVLMR